MIATSPLVLSDLELGAHTLQVRAVDLAGNTDASPATSTWTVVADTTAPDTTITAGLSGLNVSLSGTFEFTGSDDTTLPEDLEFECSFDEAAFEPCSSPEEVQDLEVSAHSFAVRAIDAAGNVDPTPAVLEWTTVDSTPPESVISASPPASTPATTALFSFSSSEAGSTFECALDAAALAPCTSPVNLTGLTVGPHTFTVIAIDAAGNQDPTPASFAWTVTPPPDTTPPETTISASPPASTPTTTASFSFTSSETGSTFQCALDAAAFAACTSPVNLTGLGGRCSHVPDPGHRRGREPGSDAGVVRLDGDAAAGHDTTADDDLGLPAGIDDGDDGVVLVLVE